MAFWTFWRPWLKSQKSWPKTKNGEVATNDPWGHWPQGWGIFLTVPSLPHLPNLPFRRYGTGIFRSHPSRQSTRKKLLQVGVALIPQGYQVRMNLKGPNSKQSSVWCEQYDLFILYSFKGFFPQQTFFKSSPFGGGNTPSGLFLKIYWVRRVAGLGDLTGEFLPFQTAVWAIQPTRKWWKHLKDRHLLSKI